MQTTAVEWHDAGSLLEERPSASFVRAVANLLETDAGDLLSELGYIPTEAVVGDKEMAAV